ncbi:MAG: hypothetical protein WC192_02605, partial [Candidatus Babeliales bacterium]
MSKFGVRTIFLFFILANLCCKNGFAEISFQDLESTDLESVTLRSIELPISYDNIYSNIQLAMAVPPTGSLLLISSQINNLFTESNGVFAPFNITLRDRSIISMA